MISDMKKIISEDKYGWPIEESNETISVVEDDSMKATVCDSCGEDLKHLSGEIDKANKPMCSACYDALIGEESL